MTHKLPAILFCALILSLNSTLALTNSLRWGWKLMSWSIFYPADESKGYDTERFPYLIITGDYAELVYQNISDFYRMTYAGDTIVLNNLFSILDGKYIEATEETKTEQKLIIQGNGTKLTYMAENYPRFEFVQPPVPRIEKRLVKKHLRQSWSEQKRFRKNNFVDAKSKEPQKTNGTLLPRKAIYVFDHLAGDCPPYSSDLLIIRNSIAESYDGTNKWFYHLWTSGDTLMLETFRTPSDTTKLLVIDDGRALKDVTEYPDSLKWDWGDTTIIDFNWDIFNKYRRYVIFDY